MEENNMLLNVHIKNLALIEDANINFTDKLNILTGETGAGKSIIIGALKIGMGGKLPKDMLRDPDKEGFCQLMFLVDDKQVIDELISMDITPSEDGEIIITRRIVNGRTLNTINDVAVTAAKLKAAASLLIDMHAQHEQQTLLKKAEHLNILDKYGRKNISPLKEKVYELYRKYENLKKELDNSFVDESEKARRTEFIKFEIKEIEEAHLKTGEDEELEKQYRKMIHAKDIVEVASEVHETTGYNDAASAGNQIGRALISMKSVKELDSAMDSIYSQLENIDALLNDFNVELSDYMQSMEFDEASFKEVEDRLNVINNLKGKYGRTIEDVLEYLENLKQEYNKLTEYDEYIEELKKQVESAEKDMLKAAEELSSMRKKEAAVLCKKITEALIDLSFMEVTFDMVCDTLDKCGPNGMDDCYFIISTNVGEKARPLYEVASGGELSRIMLAIKSCMASEDNIDTLVFDEIDVGISGRAAQKVAEKLAVISKSHQVISITHLPQIAAMADSHYLIEKNVENQKTVTHIKKLSEEASISEIARLLGGAAITETAINNAREMKYMAKETK
jgi:DNA repair protein RecN (Recombination protein N)